MYNVVTYYPRRQHAPQVPVLRASRTPTYNALARPFSVRHWSETHLARTRQLLEWEGQTDGRASVPRSVAPFPCT